jgi:hypothetical protein
MKLTDIRHWRKTTWAFAGWGGLMLAWLGVSLFTRTDTGAACSSNADVMSGAQAKRDCVEAANAVGGFDPLMVVAIAVAGLLVLTAVRFMTRPLWRQGHGASFRRRPAPFTLAEKRANRERRDRVEPVRDQPAH